MAAAAIDRLELSRSLVQDHIDSEVLSPSVMLPQVGQGALAIECREDDDDARAALAAIEHESSRRAVDAERAFLTELGGDCDLPAGAYATASDDGYLTVDALLASLDGHIVMRERASGREPVPIG